VKGNDRKGTTGWDGKVPRGDANGAEGRDRLPKARLIDRVSFRSERGVKFRSQENPSELRMLSFFEARGQLISCAFASFAQLVVPDPRPGNALIHAALSAAIFPNLRCSYKNSRGERRARFQKLRCFPASIDPGRRPPIRFVSLSSGRAARGWTRGGRTRRKSSG